MRARIVTTHGKVVYGVFGLIGVTLVSVPAAVMGGPAGAAFAVVLFWALIAVGARLFRGGDEPVAPPRAWWRLTAAPTAGFVIAGLFALQLLVSAVVGWAAGLSTGAAAGGPASTGDGSLGTAAALGAGVAAVAYLHSSLRLRGGQR